MAKDAKVQIIDMLNSRASLEDIQQIKYEKTNKTDTDMVMKSVDILHKQFV